jgi:Histidine kinase/Y_Y_Y domain
MKRLFILVVCIGVWCTGMEVRGQNSPLPAGVKYDLHADYGVLTRYVIPCINWLQQTPLGVNEKERYRVDEFVMHWLERNPDIDISMPDYSLKFHGINREFLYLFMEGWIKYTLETKDNDHVACNIAGLRSMLDYYLSGKAAEAGKVEYLDNLAKIDKDGKLKNLFDTSQTAQNTFLYLTTPHTKQQYKYDENYFSFKFYCINLINPRDITFRYMLDGYYDKWITTTDGSVTYPRLPPGDYTFRVQGTMYDNFNHAPESSFSFTIGKPLWKENWFLSIVAAACLLLVYLVIKQREKNLKNIALLKHERVVFEYEHLKSQVNPHFLFNSLNTLTNLIATNRDKAIAYTESLSGLYHNILAYHENDLVLLSEEIAILDNYISIQKGRFGDTLQMNINIPAEVMSGKKVVPLTLQILIENAIKHNVVSEKEPLIITISATENEITICNVVHPKLTREKGAGIGLVNIKRRYELLTKKPVIYGIEGDKYVVKLPLL